jgi:prolipoprotein diacylglyceryltransferase
MIALCVYSVISILLISYFIFLSDSKKKGALESLILIVIGLVGVFIERIIDKQFDLITLFFVILSVCLTILYLWLKKRFFTEAKTIKKKKHRKKTKKKIKS